MAHSNCSLTMVWELSKHVISIRLLTSRNLQEAHVTDRKTEAQGSSVSGLASKCQSQDLNPGELPPEPTFLMITLHLPHNSYHSSLFGKVTQAKHMSGDTDRRWENLGQGDIYSLQEALINSHH